MSGDGRRRNNALFLSFSLSSSLSLCHSNKLTCSSFSGFRDTAVTSASWPRSSETSVPAAEEEQDASSPPLPAAVDVADDVEEHE